MNWYIGAFKKFAMFEGRARRTEYWMFALFNLIISLAISVLENALGLSIKMEVQGQEVPLYMGYIGIAYSLIVLIPGLSLFWRRMHDINKSGAMFFIALIPIIGVIWLIVLCVTAGDVGPNNYGEDPKAS